MAKAKTKTTNVKLDMMSVTVLLVMSIFGGIVGYYLGKGASTPQVVQLKQAATLLQEKGAEMQDAGRFLDDQGKKSGSKEMMDKGTALMQDGSSMINQGAGMGDMMTGY